MKKIQRRVFLKAMGLTTAALGLTACGGSGDRGTDHRRLHLQGTVHSL